MDNIIGSVEELARHDKAYVVSLVKDTNSVRVIATCIKDRYAKVLEGPRILYEVPNSPSTYYTVRR